MSIRNLNLELRDLGGSAVLATAASASTGNAESLCRWFVSGGTLYLRVSEEETPTLDEPKLYKLSLAVTQVVCLATKCPGDVDGDNDIDSKDLQLLLKAYAADCASADYDVRADFDCNGVFDDDDLAVLLEQFGQPC
jgi:hypothetical protein